MKASQLIADALSEWRTFQDAADLAQQHFDALDEEEISRLAVRAFTEEFRATLRRKDSNGVPLYANVQQVDPVSGETSRRYKQTQLFDESDYKAAIASCQQRSRAELRTAKALADDCLTRLGVQLAFDGRAA